MSRDDLDDLVVVLVQRRRGQMAGLALVLRDHLVGDAPHQVLEEPVLAALGRERVGLERQHLLADERGQQGLEVAGASR